MKIHENSHHIHFPIASRLKLAAEFQHVKLKIKKNAIRQLPRHPAIVERCNAAH